MENINQNLAAEDPERRAFGHGIVLKQLQTNPVSLVSPKSAKDGIPLQLPAPPPGLTGKDVEKWRKEMGKLLLQQRKDSQRMEKLLAKEGERSAQCEAKMRKKVEKITSKLKGNSFLVSLPPTQRVSPVHSPRQPDVNINPDIAGRPTAERFPDPMVYALDTSNLHPEQGVQDTMDYEQSMTNSEESRDTVEEMQPLCSNIQQLNGEDEVRKILAARRKRIDDIESQKASDEENSKSLAELIKQSKTIYFPRTVTPSSAAANGMEYVDADDVVMDDIPCTPSQPAATPRQDANSYSFTQTEHTPTRPLAGSAVPSQDINPFQSVQVVPKAYNVPINRADTGTPSKQATVLAQRSVQQQHSLHKQYAPPQQQYTPSRAATHVIANQSGQVGLGIFLGCHANSREYIVCGIIPKGPAALSGKIRVNDIIESIDEMRLCGLPAADVEALMQGEPESLACISFWRPTSKMPSSGYLEHENLVHHQCTLERVPPQSNYMTSTPQRAASDSSFRVQEAATLPPQNNYTVGGSSTPQRVQSASSETSFRAQDSSTPYRANSETTVPGTPKNIPTYSSATQSNTMQGKCGVGVSFELDAPTGTLTVASIHVECPLFVGDELVNVDGMAVKGHALLVPSILWGEPGSAVSVRVSRVGAGTVDARLIRKRTAADANILTSKGGGRTCGIGIVLEKELNTNFFYVKRVVDGGPAWAAGLQQGDMLIEIDGVDLRPVQKDRLPGLVVGTEGTVVRVKCLQGNDSEPREVVMMRSLDTAKVQSSNLATRLRVMLDDSKKDFSSASTAEFALAMCNDIVDALETEHKRVQVGRVIRSTLSFAPISASVVVLPDFENKDARTVEDLVKDFVYQASNQQSKLRQKPTAAHVTRADVISQVAGDEEEPLEAEPDDMTSPVKKILVRETATRAAAEAAFAASAQATAASTQPKSSYLSNVPQVVAQPQKSFVEAPITTYIYSKPTVAVEQPTPVYTPAYTPAVSHTPAVAASSTYTPVLPTTSAYSPALAKSSPSTTTKSYIQSREEEYVSMVSTRKPTSPTASKPYVAREEELHASFTKSSPNKSYVQAREEELYREAQEAKALTPLATTTPLWREEQDLKEGTRYDYQVPTMDKYQRERTPDLPPVQSALSVERPMVTRPVTSAVDIEAVAYGMQTLTTDEQWKQATAPIFVSRVVKPADPVESEEEQSAPVHDLTHSSQCSSDNEDREEPVEEYFDEAELYNNDDIEEDDDEGEMDDQAMGRRMLAILGHPLEAPLEPKTASVTVHALPATPTQPPAPKEDSSKAVEPKDDSKSGVWSEAQKLRAKYPDRVPVVVSRAEMSIAPELSDSKFLAHGGKPIEDFLRIVSRRVERPVNHLKFEIGGFNEWPPGAETEEIYNNFCDDQGLLRITYDYASDEFANALPPTVNTPNRSILPPLVEDEEEEMERSSQESIESPRDGMLLQAEAVSSAPFSVPTLAKSDDSARSLSYDSHTTPTRSAAPTVAPNTPGVGMLIEAKRDGQIRIAALAPGGPAERCGKVTVGDELVAVDGQAVKGRSTAQAASLLSKEGGRSVQLTIIRGGLLHKVTVERGAAPVTAASESMEAERRNKLEEVSKALDSVQARMDEGFELPPMHESFMNYAYILKNFTLRASELLDECDGSIRHCNTQQKLLDEIAKYCMPSDDPALDKKHVYDCAQVACRVMALLDELEACKHRLIESDSFFRRKLKDLEENEPDEIVT